MFYLVISMHILSSREIEMFSCHIEYLPGQNVTLYEIIYEIQILFSVVCFFSLASAFSGFYLRNSNQIGSWFKYFEVFISLQNEELGTEFTGSIRTLFWWVNCARDSAIFLYEDNNSSPTKVLPEYIHPLITIW